MRKLILLAVPCVLVLLSGCGSSGGSYSQAHSYESTSSGGYATYSDYSGSKYAQSMPHSASGREYPVNRTETVRTG